MKLMPSIIVMLILCFSYSGILFAQAAVNTLTTPSNTENPTQTGFKVVICDGPKLPNGVTPTSGTAGTYTVCDFNGMVLQVQHLINIFMVLGVLAAIVLFTYAGFLLLTGKEANIKTAKDIFPKIGIGFIIMLSAWAIVYEILVWLTGPNSIFIKLLGK